jgi:6-pyruvoyltetrahydropterin/6-carboxytetrahydropterin synthase
MDSAQTSTIALFRNDMKFSSGHFTIFSATERERLHGHNFQVRVEITAEIQEAGITYDYSHTRRRILSLCKSLNEYMLLPQYSPYLKITEDEIYYYAEFANEKMTFLKADTLILPIKNVTSECLAQWFVDQLIEDKTDLAHKRIVGIKAMISITVGQYATANWQRDNE